MVSWRELVQEGIFENKKFKNWNDFNEKRTELERIIKNQFPEHDIDLKLIGSAATGTMRAGEGDFDYFIGFEQQVDKEYFKERIEESGVTIDNINDEKKHNYSKLTGQFEGYEFVMVPTTKPGGTPTNYTHDAYHHPEFINYRKDDNHAKNVILSKEFFEKTGVYKKVKGIGCELLTLYYKDFDEMLRAITENENLRINYSGKDSTLEGPLIIDYPIIGCRSLTSKVTEDDWKIIRGECEKALYDDNYLI